LVTRPEPDNIGTAETLRGRGFHVLLAPMLRFQPLPLQYNDEASFAGVIVTSTNALRAIEGHALIGQLGDKPVFAVGERTADAARATGFANVATSDGDMVALRKLIAEVMGKPGRGVRRAPLLYLHGADVSGDMRTDLAQGGIAVTALPVYRMVAISQFPSAVTSALAARGVEAVLHYSGRSAQSFVAALRAEALEIAGLAVPQVCISAVVARVLRDAGATQTVAAEKPREDAMMEALERTLRPPRS
jgi:uroporphyrinogen-III synthase